MPLAQIESHATAKGQEKSTPHIRYYHTDQIGLPRELSNTLGQIEWRANYKVWGNTVTVEYPDAAVAAEDIHQPLRFQGQYYDSETGLHYNRFRYYDPGIGRFVTQDPIGLLGGTNNYQYAPSPVVWIETSGLMSKPVNLPAARKIKIDMEHILDRHTSKGTVALQSKIKSLFPDEISPIK